MNKPKRVPLRTCVVCKETDAKMKLIRVVRQKAPDGSFVILVDRAGKASGRGAYVCNRTECIELALRQRKFERSLHVSAVPEEFAEHLRSVYKAPTASGS